MAPESGPSGTGLLAAEATLAPDFSDLQPWVAKWALTTEMDRLLQRCSSTMRELQGFYDAMAPRMEAVLDALNAQPAGEWSAEQHTLYRLAQSFFEVSLVVELLRMPDGTEMLPPSRLNVDIEGGF